MAWRESGDKPLSEAMMIYLLMHICVTRPQWVKRLYLVIAFNILTSTRLKKLCSSGSSGSQYLIVVLRLKRLTVAACFPLISVHGFVNASIILIGFIPSPLKLWHGWAIALQDPKRSQSILVKRGCRCDIYLWCILWPFIRHTCCNSSYKYTFT